MRCHQTLEGEIKVANERRADCERRLAESEERASNLSASIQRMREGMEGEVATLTARCAGQERSLQVARECTTTLTSELEVCCTCTQQWQ